MKNLKGSVYDATKAVFEGEFPGGEILNLGVEVEGVQISADFSRFETFTEADYDALYADLVADKDGLASNIPNDSTVEDISTVDFSRVTVEFIE
jgi:basic membrane protein A